MGDKIQFYIRICLVLATILPGAKAFGIPDSLSKNIDLSYRDYMKIVLSDNIEYRAEKYNIDIAEAEIESAGTIQDPSFDVERSSSQEEGAPEEYSLTAELSKTFELGGTRRARINLAKSGSEVARSALDEYLRELYAGATEDYLNAMMQESLYRVLLNSWQMMKDLADADSVRLNLGSIKYIDAAQSRIEAGMLFNEVLSSDAERKASLLNLSLRMGRAGDTIFTPTGRFDNYYRKYDPDSLLNSAFKNRADLRLAGNNISYYRQFLELTKSERAPDIDLRIGSGQAYSAGNVMNPAVHDIYAGISIPLKFSNINKGELKMAKYRIGQSELIHSQVELQVKNEILQAFHNYEALCSQVKNFDNGLLGKSDEVLRGKIYSYSRGETSLLEVLNAQRTCNDIRISYIRTLYNCFIALVELEKAEGVFRIDL